jgi:hypothetical protein
MSAAMKYHWPAGPVRFLCGRSATFSRGGLVTDRAELVECKRCKAKLEARALRQAAKAAAVAP